MSKPVIAVDIDDVLALSTEALRREVNELLDVELRTEDYLVAGEYDDYYEKVWERHGLNDRINIDDMYPRMKANQAHVKSDKDAYEVLKKLSRDYELIIVTGRHSDWQTATEAWLADNFPDIFSKVFFANGSEGLKRKSKGQLCVENNASWLIDDNVEHALSAQELGVEAIVFGSYGWHHELPPHIVHCRDWKAIGDYFDGRG